MPFSNGATWHLTMLLAQGTCTPATLPRAQPAMWHPTDPPAPSVTLHLVSPAALFPIAPWPQAPASTSSWIQSPPHILSPFLPHPPEVPSPLCSQQCWRGTAPQSSHGCPGPGGQQHPPPVSLARGPSFTARPTSLGRHTRRGRPGRWLPPYRRQAY